MCVSLRSLRQKCSSKVKEESRCKATASLFLSHNTQTGWPQLSYSISTPTNAESKPQGSRVAVLNGMHAPGQAGLALPVGLRHVCMMYKMVQSVTAYSSPVQILATLTHARLDVVLRAAALGRSESTRKAEQVARKS